MERPALDTTLAADEFRRWYWLKAELLAFARQQGLATTGAKQALAERIAHFLATGERLRDGTAQRPVAPRSGSTELTGATVIWPGFRCGQQARAFFLAAIGPHFHFDQQMRDFINDNPGKTLDDAVAAWHVARAAPREATIAPQFEYNRHMREYYAQHSDATRAEAISAWREKRNTRRAE